MERKIKLDKEKIENEINKISLYMCQGVEAGNVIHYFFPEKSGVKQIIRSLVKTVYYSMFSFCEFEQIGTPKTLTLFSNSFLGRSDHRRAFDNVVELIDDQLIVTPSRRKFNFANIKYLFLPFIWTYQMRKTSASLFERIVLSCSSLLRAFYDCIDVERYIKKNNLDIKYLITYCDVMPVDSFLIQKFKARGIITVTLQHGTFITGLNSWAYLGSKSNYFLAESQVAIDSAKEIGYKGNMIAVGSPHMIGSQNTCKPDAFKAETLGIIMNTDMIPIEENIDMIKTVREYCKSHGKKLLLKYHPANNRDLYSKIIDVDFVKTYGTEITAEQFGDMVDVAIISASTVFNTMLMKWKPVLLFAREGHDIGMFKGTDDIKFSSEEQLVEKITIIETPKYKQLMEKYRNYFLCSGKYEDNYRNAFKKIGIL